MSDKQARVSRYAQAIFQMMVERWQNGLDSVTAAIAGNEQLAALLADSGKDTATKLAAVEKALPAGLPADVGNFVRLLVQEGDVAVVTAGRADGDHASDDALMPWVAAALAQTAGGRSGPSRAGIVSAVELTAEEQADLRRMLTQQHGEGLVFDFRVDPALLGGLRVRVGDRLIDTSVASRLALLRESLASAVR